MNHTIGKPHHVTTKKLKILADPKANNCFWTFMNHNFHMLLKCILSLAQNKKYNNYFFIATYFAFILILGLFSLALTIHYHSNYYNSSQIYLAFMCFTPTDYNYQDNNSENLTFPLMEYVKLKLHP